MQNFADRLLAAIEEKGNPCMVGLDPRFDLIPRSFFSDDVDLLKSEIIEDTLFEFNSTIIDAIKDLVPTIKLQSAFYETYGVPGIWAMERSIKYAQEAGLITVVDGKRNDIGSTAEAYANAYIGASKFQDETKPVFNADALTVSPYMGTDSLLPFVDACKKYGKGIFVLVKTSNKGSGDIQNLVTEDGEKVYEKVAKMVADLGKETIGTSGYNAIGAVVGATYPEEAKKLRAIMPHTLFLVPGYGAQGGSAEDTLPAFNTDKKGALIHSSRGVLFEGIDASMSKEQYGRFVRSNTEKMIEDIKAVLLK